MDRSVKKLLLKSIFSPYITYVQCSALCVSCGGYYQHTGMHNPLEDSISVLGVVQCIEGISSVLWGNILI